MGVDLGLVLVLSYNLAMGDILEYVALEWRTRDMRRVGCTTREIKDLGRITVGCVYG